MTERSPTSSSSKKANEICRWFEPTDEARSLLRDDLPADAYLALLRARELYDDALQFWAYWLTKREAVWWGCLCLWNLSRPNLPVPEADAMRAVVRWVLDCSEDNRRNVEMAADAAGPGTAAGCLALAAFWSSESMAPVGLPEVSPPPFLTGKTVVAALNLLTAQAKPGSTKACQRSFLYLASDVARVVDHWNQTNDRVPSATSSRTSFR